MKAKEIEIGKVYVMKVSGRLVSVRVTGTREVAHGRAGWRTAWDGVNLATGRRIVVRSPQRFRARFERLVSHQVRPEAKKPAETDASRIAIIETTTCVPLTTETRNP